MDTDIDSSACSLAEPYALQVLGVDMAPEFPDRCIIIIDPTDKCSDGAYVFVEVEGVRWLRQYREDSMGHKWLAASNELFPIIELDGLDYKILGVVTQRNIRRQIKHYSYPLHG